MDTPFNAKLAISTPFGLYESPAGGMRLPCVSVEWHRARMALIVPCGYNLAEIRADGWETGVARHKVVEEAVRRKVKYLFFLDWDVLVPPLTLTRLTYLAENNPDYDIFSGIYCVKQEPAEVLVWKEWGSGVHWDWTLGDVLTDCVGVGAGCLLIRMSLFERLDGVETPWFKTIHETIEDDVSGPSRRFVTDDLFFCKRAVEEVGAKILVDTGILCGHIDNDTGVVYTLTDDCLPIKRYNGNLLATIQSKSHEWLGNDDSALKEITREVVESNGGGPKTVVEIGSFIGTTSKVIADELNGHGTLHCVDTWEGTHNEYTSQIGASLVGKDAMYHEFKRNMDGRIGKTIIPHKDTSTNVAADFASRGLLADMVFIDADHKRCEEDIRTWLPLVKRDGGIICGHDYSPEFPEVIEAVGNAFGGTAVTRGRIWIKRLSESSA